MLGGVTGATVELAGEIDAATVGLMKQDIGDAIAANPGTIVTIDMTGVTFLDSTGLGALVSALRQAHDNGGDIRITNVASNVRKVFDITGLSKVFELA